MINASNPTIHQDQAASVMPAEVPRDLLQQEDDWEFQLDLLGTSATVEQLQSHLDACPNPGSATAQYLQGYLSHATQAPA